MPFHDALRAHLACRLERGDPSAPARAAGAIWGAIAASRLARPLVLPRGLRVIGVGSAVLGGAGKTPLSIALALELTRRGKQVAIIGHAYRATPGRARVVLLTDHPAEVGDDALACARALIGTGAPVIVAPRRQLALDHAAVLGVQVAIADGLLQARPRRLDAAILVQDAAAPWGSLACPPAGDLRAPRGALLAASDHQALITSTFDPRLPSSSVVVPSQVRAASMLGGPRRTLAELAPLRTGLFLTVARPERIVAALRQAGIEPAPILTLADHASPSPRDLRRAHLAPVDVWLTTARCAVKLPERLGAAPVLAIEHELDVRALVERLASGGHLGDFCPIV